MSLVIVPISGTIL